MARVLSIVLAGGEGKRLLPLTLDRAKPAVPFGGHYRLIDFALSNLANAGLLRVVVLTQYKSHSLDLHISRTWRLSTLLGNYVTPVPAQMRRGPWWFSGSADAIYQNLNIVGDEQPEYLLVFGADHIYRMDPRQMLAQHMETGAAATVAAIRVPAAEAGGFGIIEPGEGTLIDRFIEKPSDPLALAAGRHHLFASMGNYIFTADALVDALREDAQDSNSRHDMGGDIVPHFVEHGEAHFYDFYSNIVPGCTDLERGYWRDVGTLDAYYDASMDLVAVQPIFNLYNTDWPIFTNAPQSPPAKFVFEEPGRIGMAVNSIVSAGSIISGGTVRHSVISPRVLVENGALVEDSVIMDNVIVGEGAVVKSAIIDKNVVIGAGARVGTEPEIDASHFTISARGVVVIGKGEKVVG
ncbi:MAG TPA: glucose-1-phosphate adenylyltransferase [Acidimicrobiales bacterium]|nr:glucose-1-phosphate adenylyltransferase [Acidimicrobiales bacterium]